MTNPEIKYCVSCLKEFMPQDSEDLLCPDCSGTAQPEGSQTLKMDDGANTIPYQNREPFEDEASTERFCTRCGARFG